jgi:hypothetical protein
LKIIKTHYYLSKVSCHSNDQSGLEILKDAKILTAFKEAAAEFLPARRGGQKFSGLVAGSER